MLVLTRQVGERLRIGENVVVTLTQTSCGKVRLAIEAPRDVVIKRGELVDAWEDRRTDRSVG
ncbi:MAG: carbon storage regulator [Planctomycetaceae bacterium]|nr:carbon storage regulator [Planctomycetaceae bacterium]